MAKATSPKAPGASRIRFIMVEAEMADAGDLSQITQAIQNALRPATTSVRLTGPTHARSNGGGASTQSGETVVDADEEEAVGQDADMEAADASRSTSDTPRRARKLRSPEVLELDLTTEPSFAQFAEDKEPDEQPEAVLDRRRLVQAPPSA